MSGLSFPKKKQREPIPNDVRFEVFKRDGFRCQYCGWNAKERGVKEPDNRLEIDHIKAHSLSGADKIYNLITSCHYCNYGKGWRPLHMKLISLFSGLKTKKKIQKRVNKKLEEIIELKRRERNLIRLAANIGNESSKLD